MSIARVTNDGIEIEYTDARSGITVLHRVSEKEGEPFVEDYYKGKNGTLTRAEDGPPADDPKPAEGTEDPEPAADGETVRVLGFRFKRTAAAE